METADWIVETIETEFPQLRLKQDSASRSVPRTFGTIADYALDLLNKAEHHQVKRFMKMMDSIYGRCNVAARLAIENVFVYRVGTHISSCDYRRRLVALLPESFRDIMMKQFNAPAI